MDGREICEVVLSTVLSHSLIVRLVLLHRGCRNDRYAGDVGGHQRGSQYDPHGGRPRVRSLGHEHGLRHVHHSHVRVCIGQDSHWIHRLRAHLHGHHVGDEDVHHVGSQYVHRVVRRCGHSRGRAGGRGLGACYSSCSLSLWLI